MPDESHMVRSARNAQEFHPGFFRSAVPLLVVASHAGAHEVLPSIFTAASLRYHVVDGQKLISASAVLAMVAVASQNILP